MSVTKGATNVSQYFYIVQDASATSPGEPVTGLLFSDIETGGSASYARQGAARVDLTLITLASASAAHADGGFILVDDTNMPGLYRCDYPDAAFATGADQVNLAIVVASANNAVAAPIKVVLTGVDLQADQIDANIVQISGDATAGDNLESMYDGTGYVDDTAPASRSQVDGIGAASGGALNFEVTVDNATVAIKGVSKVGTETGTFANTQSEDNNYHIITHAANDIDWIYGCTVGGNRTAVEVVFAGYLTSSNDAMLIQAYDFVGADWETVALLPGKNGVTNDTMTAPLLSKHTGTGADLGLVYIRFEADGVMTSPVLNVDRLLVEAVNIGQSVGYANGAVWVDTVSGVAGTEAFTNGTADNKSLLFADAITIADAVGLDDFEMAPDANIVLAATINSRVLRGSGWTLALGAQDINDLHVFGAGVTGIGTAATRCGFHDCMFGTASVQKAFMENCMYSETVTFTLAGDYNVPLGKSAVAGAGAPTFTKTPGQTITAKWREWAGSITVSGLEAGDVVTIGGTLGTVTLNGADGTVEIRGSYKALVDNRTGSPTLNLDGAWLAADIATINTATAGLGGAAMRGTDSAALASVATEARLAELDAANLPTDIAAIPTTAMRGTDSAALASVATEARLAELDAANLPTDVAAIPTTAMRGTDSAALASVATEARLAELDAGNIPADIDSLIAALVTAAGEPAQGAPPVSASIADKVAYIYKVWRNRSNQTATETQFFADDGTTVDHKVPVSDDATTAEKGEVVTGP